MRSGWRRKRGYQLLNALVKTPKTTSGICKLVKNRSIVLQGGNLSVESCLWLAGAFLINPLMLVVRYENISKDL